jgi:nucleoid-associated protein EbfC
MFDNLFGNLQKQQEELQEKLATILVEAEAEDKAVIVKANAALEIENIKIDATKISLQDTEQLEDLLVVTVNRALELAKAKAAIETNKLLEGMMPGGLGGLLGGQ